MTSAIWLVCTMDTKHDEGIYIKNRLESRGIPVIIADVSASKPSDITADIKNYEIAQAAGYDADELFNAKQRIDAIDKLSEGLQISVLNAYFSGKLRGIISIGGSGGMSLASKAIRALPFGVPKMLVTTVASGNMRPYIGGKDVMVLNPVADLSGLNVISRKMLSTAADAMYGILSGTPDPSPTRPAVAITAFGSTDPCVYQCRELLSHHGFDSVVFHARGVSGGTVMEELIDDGMFCGVLDITTTEIADMIVGGIYPSEYTRLDYLGKIPAVVSSGALDMVNFCTPDTIPQQYANRTFIRHGIATTLMRTSADELKQVAEFISRKAHNASNCRLILPSYGFSFI